MSINLEVLQRSYVDATGVVSQATEAVARNREQLRQAEAQLLSAQHRAEEARDNYVRAAQHAEVAKGQRPDGTIGGDDEAYDKVVQEQHAAAEFNRTLPVETPELTRNLDAGGRSI